MNRKFFGLILIAGLLLPAAAWADDYTPLTKDPAWEFTTANAVANNGVGYTFGTEFTPDENLYVYLLGYFYDPLTGMQESHGVGLYTSTGSLLASTVITSASINCSPALTASAPCNTNPAHFLYNVVPTVELLAGQTYILESTSGLVDPYADDDPGFSVLWPLTIDGGIYAQAGSDLGFVPVPGDITDGYFGADMGFESPEPVSFLLLGSGLLGLAFLIKRKVAA
ncbi:MAG: hypothetical protein ABR906_07755 [Terracidiphilus sp.]|jgi:hypothetical protein